MHSALPSNQIREYIAPQEVSELIFQDLKMMIERDFPLPLGDDLDK